MTRIASYGSSGRSQRLIRTFSDAARFVDDAGFCMLFPVRNVPLPSLYHAVTGRNLFEDWIWDEYSEKVWGWKDDLPRRRAFYGKYLRGRGTLISIERLPNFLAMAQSAEHADEHEEFYAAGRISNDARTVWQALAKHGPLATLELRHACGMERKAGNIRFKRAILDLQKRLIAVHSGTEQETGAWASACFDLTCRVFPEQARAAQRISLHEARARLAKKFAEHQPSAGATGIARLFGWRKADAQLACNDASVWVRDRAANE